MKPAVPGRKRRLLHLCFMAVLIFGSACFLNAYVVGVAMVHGDSMEPAFYDGDLVLVNKAGLRFEEPERFDVVIFPYRYRKNTYLIKRIVGLPGESVQIRDGRLLINGRELEESYGAEPIRNAKRAADPVILGEHEYFVLGDNRNHSTDSRDFDVANVTKDEMTGKVIQWRKH